MQEAGCLFIIDEVTSGFRMCFGGYHSNFGLTPDAVVYGKTLSSGIPFSALVCNDNLAEGIKILSSAYWSDSGVAAAYSTLSILERRGNYLYPHINAVGSEFLNGLNSVGPNMRLMFLFPRYQQWPLMLSSINILILFRHI